MMKSLLSISLTAAIFFAAFSAGGFADDVPSFETDYGVNAEEVTEEVISTDVTEQEVIDITMGTSMEPPEEAASAETADISSEESHISANTGECADSDSAQITFSSEFSELNAEELQPEANPTDNSQLYSAQSELESISNEIQNSTEISVAEEVNSGVKEETVLPDAETEAGMELQSESDQMADTSGDVGIISSGVCGDQLTWEVREDGVLFISGTGEMQQYGLYKFPWNSFSESIRSVEISEGVTSVAESAFRIAYSQGDRKLESITIPATLTEWGYSAVLFVDSIQLNPANANYELGEDGCLYTKGGGELVLTPSSISDSYTVPASANLIRNSAVCGPVKSIVLHENVIVEPYAFAFAYNLSEFTVSPQNPYYATDGICLFNKDWTSLIRCGRGGQGDYTLPDTVTGLSSNAFMDCFGFSSIHILSDLQYVEGGAFGNMSLMNGCMTIYFTGKAPEFSSTAFAYTVAEVHYPQEDSSWDTVIGEQYGGQITWVADAAESTLPTDPETGVGFIIEGEKLVYTQNGERVPDKFGFVMFDGGKFLIANGELASSINGVFNDPEDSATWWFCANGQVQLQHTGLALYDGEWFYICNGALDTGMNSLVEYDGGMFYVAAGRIVSEANGLVIDPNSSDWYFVSGGQVQTQYTGIAEYDGSYFYIINGRLASEYSGRISSSGVDYDVTNGQAAPVKTWTDEKL